MDNNTIAIVSEGSHVQTAWRDDCMVAITVEELVVRHRGKPKPVGKSSELVPAVKESTSSEDERTEIEQVVVPNSGRGRVIVPEETINAVLKLGNKAVDGGLKLGNKAVDRCFWVSVIFLFVLLAVGFGGIVAYVYVAVHKKEK